MLSRVVVSAILLLIGAVGGMVLPPWLAFMWGLVLVSTGVLFNCYPDKLLLHFFQAREATEAQYPAAHRAARNQCFKLHVGPPQIYAYSGHFHRAYAFASGRRSAFVVERSLLEKASPYEVDALWFALALQVKDGSAGRETLGLALGSLCWAPMLKLAGVWKRPPFPMVWATQLFLAPLSRTLHRLVVGADHAQKSLGRLAAYPNEARRLQELNARLDQPRLHQSPSRDLAFRVGAATHGRQEQMILALESMAHPLDLFAAGELTHA